MNERGEKEAKSLHKENETQLLEENYVEIMTIALNVKYRPKARVSIKILTSNTRTICY